MKAMQCWMPAKPWEKNALALQKSMKFGRHMHLLPLRQQPRLDNCTMSLRLEFAQKIVPKAISIHKPRDHFLSKLYMNLIQAGQLITSLTSPIRSKWISITSALNLLKHAWSSGHIFGWIQSISTSNLCQVAAWDMLGRHTGDWMMCSVWTFDSDHIDDTIDDTTVTQSKQHPHPLQSKGRNFQWNFFAIAPHVVPLKWYVCILFKQTGIKLMKW